MAEAWFSRLTDTAETWSAREDTGGLEATITPNVASVTTVGQVATTLRDLVILAGRGQVTIGGQQTSVATNVRTPLVGAATVQGRTPFVQQVTGPTRSPDRAGLTLATLAISLRKERRIYPLLPEGTSTDNDLTPTILLGSSDFAGAPQRGILLIEGRPPALIKDNTLTIEVSAALNPVTVVYNALVPTIVVEDRYRSEQYPFRGEITMLGLQPSTYRERVIAPAVGSLQMQGAAEVTQAYDYSWRTVELVGAAGWTDIRRAT